MNSPPDKATDDGFDMTLDSLNTTLRTSTLNLGLSYSKGGYLYPVDSAIGFPSTYPLDSDLSGG